MKKSHETAAVILGGPTKVGKTFLAHELTKGLSDMGTVETQVAGNFFRKVTLTVLDELGSRERTDYPEDELADAIGVVLARGELLVISNSIVTTEKELCSAPVSKIVSSIGARPEAQAAGDEWYEFILQEAQRKGTDYLLVDGRTPRDHQEQHYDTYGCKVGLQFVVDCTVAQAAQRSLASLGNLSPNAIDLAHEEANIRKRRAQDATRPDFPFYYPANSVVLNGDPLEQVVEQMWTPVEGVDLPRPVYFDTTRASKEHASEAVVGLAVLALSAPSLVQ
jgi:cytidylate kinase